MKNNLDKSKWNKIFENGIYMWECPNPQIKRLVPFLKERKVNKILDVGCGAGRHMIYLGKKGFTMVGLNISTKALSITQKLLEKAKIKNYVLIENKMENLPFPDEHFDAVVSINVIHHDKLKDIKKTVSEIKRVLKKRGIIILNLVSIDNSKFGIGTEIEKNTFISPSKRDKGVIHHFFTEEDARKLFSGFKIREFKRDIEHNTHWFILGEK
jgi:ubiquinone/menaquinone biosynthesis C-methylase UbiE